MKPVRVAAGVYAIAGSMTDLADAAPHPADSWSARRIPRWRVREYLNARILLRRLLAEVADMAAGSPIAARAHGGPYLVRRPEVGVSLSHTGEWVAAAVHLTGTVGVDTHEPVRADDRMVRRCCTRTARARLARLPERDRAVELAWIWSVQEACVKSTGAGVADRPWTIPVEVGQHTGRWRAVEWIELRGEWPVPVSCAHGTPTAGGGACKD
ncbi:4'-phosphopantetheinyl transferase superfamily protein [Kibdelosporangium persicum]|uniref:4'-phosphopantetheinyl transferase n=1 Tax=Kibdelosporangium persicum TaxID=2698649 RepID=A0ABX2FDI0_9PSEU|nr:4'-phosphopantetheinyl transferase superfamily protein [Kibdelosporangium persicum]NRN69417.1 4'-phosphopantetheinyl transferase [Kibdelosporangium persicum]